MEVKYMLLYGTEVSAAGSSGRACVARAVSAKQLQRRYTVYIANRDINPGYFGAMHCCKAPLWGRRLDLDSLNLTPRFAHRLLLLL